jgi:two-component system, OmpR family, sensor kinase
VTARTSLAARTVALAVLVALLASVATGVALARTLAAGNRERIAATLAVNADNLADRVDTGRPLAGRVRIAQLQRQGVVVDVVRRGQAVTPPFTADDVRAAPASPDPVERRSGGRSWLVVGRATGDGGAVLLARPVGTGAGLTTTQVRRALFGALIVLLVAATAGLLLARSVTRPLRQLATAARRLTAGERAVAVGGAGPREVADVGAALDALAGRLAQAEDRQRRFLLAVSHELRTPLTAVTGYAEALAEGVLPAEEMPRAGEVIRTEAARLQGRVDDLMALARLQADDFHLEPAVVDVGAVVRAAAAAWAPRAGAAGVRLTVQGPGAPVHAWADGERVRQAVDALADNALRVLPAGAPLVLAYGGGSGGARPWVQVRDGGPGLTPGDLAHAFEPGRLTERYRGDRPVGSGLGLALVAALAERMGGRATASSAAEGGAGFTVELPPAAPPGDPNTPRTRPGPSGYTTGAP